MSTFLKGERITLRLITEQDYQKCVKWLNDQTVTRFMQHAAYPATLLGCQKYNDDLYKAGGIHLAIMVGKKHIGNIALTNINQTFRSAEISVMIGDLTEQGKGYGQEAIKLVTDHAFRKMNMHRVGAGTAAKNGSSIGAFMAAGYTEEGVRRQAYYINGEYQDIVLLSILKNEWRKVYVD